LVFCFFCRESWWGHCSWIIFSHIYFTLFMIYASRLRFYEPFFQCSLVFFSQPDVNITWITRHIHRSIVDKIDPTCEYVEMEQKKPLSITLGYIFLWNVIRRIYLPCFNWSVKILLMNSDEDHFSFFNLKSGRMANNDIFSGKLFTRSVCCFGYTLGIDFNW
jgi:hypothetical protein